MKQLSRKSLLRFGAVLIVSAFAVPSMASAGSWGAVGTTHRLFSPDLSFTGFSGGASIGWVCTNSEFDVDVRSATVLTITNGTIASCGGRGTLGQGCTTTATGTNFHWTATGLSTTNVQIHGVHVDVTFEAGPTTTCLAAGTALTLSGTLTLGAWNINEHAVIFNGAEGVSGPTGAVTVSGTIRDTTNTLTLTD